MASDFINKLCLRNVVVILFVPFLLSTKLYASNKVSKIRTIETIESQRYKAMEMADTLTLAKFLANDVAYYHSNGLLDTKKSLLEGIANNILVHKKITTSNTNYRVYKKTVIVTGNATYDIVWKGTPMVLNFVYTNVYAKQKGKWLLVNRNTVKV